MIGEAAAWMVRVLNRTLSWSVVGAERWAGGSIFTLWHGQMVLGAALLLHLNRGTDGAGPRVPLVGVVVPEYRASRAMRAWARALGVQVALVPGYERPDSRRAALRALLPALAAGASVLLPADGHCAPARRVRADPLWLAAEAGAALVPVALAARPARTLPTWDRKPVPLPGGRVAAVIGPALAAGATAEGLEAAIVDCERLAALLLG